MIVFPFTAFALALELSLLDLPSGALASLMQCCPKVQALKNGRSACLPYKPRGASGPGECRQLGYRRHAAPRFVVGILAPSMVLWGVLLLSPAMTDL